MNKVLFFDLDDTLIDTRTTKPFRKHADGRIYVAKNIQNMQSQECHPDLKKIVEVYNADKKVAVITNGSADVAHALLAKHGYPQDLPVYTGLKKPMGTNLEKVLRDFNITPDEGLVIGDRASDIIAAHEIGFASVAIVAPSSSTTEQLEKAEPNHILESAEGLAELIDNFEDGYFGYAPRKSVEDFRFVNFEDALETDPEINFQDLGTYYPVGTSEFKKDYHSKNILDFKEIKDVPLADIKAGANLHYVWKGQLRNGSNCKSILKSFTRQVIKKINSLDLKGITWVIPAPNSHPEYCYLTDVNSILVNAVNRSFDESYLKSERSICRVYPKGESHLGFRTDLKKHLSTMGIKLVNSMPKEDITNIIIFDDITTRGSQIEAVARILRTYKYTGNIVGLTLGKTINY